MDGWMSMPPLVGVMLSEEVGVKNGWRDGYDEEGRKGW